MGSMGVMGTRIPRVLLLLGAVSWLAACEGDSGRCVSNRDCPTGNQCISGSCKPQTVVNGCVTNDDCLIGEQCENSACVTIPQTDCTLDDHCPAHQKCNSVQGVCIDGYRSCTSQAQCQSAALYCAFTLQQCRECTLPEHCGAGRICVLNECVDENEVGCQTDAACQPPFTVCHQGECAAGCASVGSPVTCGGGTICDAGTGRCGPGTQVCSTDGQCAPPAAICLNQSCSPGCTEAGGLQCTGGNVCDPQTGRCVSPSGCTADTQCAPPATVCEGGQCVTGCAQIGGLACGTGSVCDTNTGRCVQLPGSCSVDGQCAPPSTVCEAGQCVGGCTQPGGLVCTGNTICNSGTGRCDPGAAVCTSDVDCGPPANICNPVSGACIPGCASSGCTGSDICNTQSGRCGPPTPTALPLNAMCTAHAECESKHCFDFAGSIGSRCVSSCGTSAQCPTGNTCYNYLGANLCVSAQLFSGATFDRAEGASCATGGQCRSGYCPNQSCVALCTNSAQCGGAACGWREIAASNYLAACTGPVGASPQGASCGSDGNCASGVCVGGRCGDLCSTTSQCPSGSICTLANYSVCSFEIGPLCVGSYIPNLVRACLTGSHGNGGIGTPCSSYLPCRSGLCYTPASQCTDTCGTDQDCPNNWRCRASLYAELPDGTPVYLNACLPE